MRSLVDEVDQAGLQEAFRILRSDYIQKDKLSFLELNRSALQGLLERLEFGAMILTPESREAANSPFTFNSDRLTPEAGYVRFGRFTKEGVTELDRALVKFTEEKPISTLILDLRSPQPMADFGIAAEILSRFRPEAEVLFKIRKEPGDQDTRPRIFTAKKPSNHWDGEIILLIDEETGNVGEIIAAVLQQKSKELIVIGTQTRGLTVEYRDVPLSENRFLRYAVAEVVLDDGTSIFRKGITPDIVTTTPSKVKQAIFRNTESKDVSMGDYIFERQRPRMSEAALVAGTDPELSYWLAKSQGEPTEWDKKPLKDRALDQAIDLLETRAFFAE